MAVATGIPEAARRFLDGRAKALWIDNEYVDATSDTTITAYNPADGSELGDVQEASVAGAGRLRAGPGMGWSANAERAHRVAHRIRAGTVWINCYDAGDVSIPFGGYKQSGHGREKGEYALELYTEVKAVVANLED